MPSLNLTLCRFKEQTLVKEEVDILSTRYYAISHVWMEDICKWTAIPGIPFKVLVSPHKAEFIEKDLKFLVGGSPFWMDVLAVDQSKEEEKVKVVEHIPAIYSRAAETIVVREDNGLKACCARSLGLIYTGEEPNPLDSEQILEEIFWHLDVYHQDWAGESWLHRVWPLQEVNLSASLRFIVCKSLEKDASAEVSAPGDPGAATASTVANYMNELRELNQVAILWATDGLHNIRREPHETEAGHDVRIARWKTEIANTALEFVRAILTSGSVVKSKGPYGDVDIPGLRSVYDFLLGSRDSTRKTGKARDFVLALFPTYAWYKPPTDVRKMSFGEIWADSVVQLGRCHDAENGYIDSSGLRERAMVKAKITQGVLRHFRVGLEEGAAPAELVPEPKCLGDFCKLFALKDDPYEREIGIGKKGDESFGEWRLLDPTRESLDYVLDAVSATLFYAETVSYELTLERLANGATKSSKADSVSGSPDRDIPQGRTAAVKIIQQILSFHSGVRATVKNADAGCESVLIFSKEWKTLKMSAREEDSPVLITNLLQVAVFLACELGLDFLEWAQGKLQPYFLQFWPRENRQGGAVSDYYFATLILAAPDLYSELQDCDQLNAYGEHTPYVVVKSPRDGMRPRIVGLAPQILRMVLWPTGDYHVQLDKGCPCAVRKLKVGQSVTPESVLEAYRNELSVKVNGEVSDPLMLDLANRLAT